MRIMLYISLFTEEDILSLKNKMEFLAMAEGYSVLEEFIVVNIWLCPLLN